ncbi:hypothetical protein HPC49_32090 [Pyxidicoccus fallax]|uniref:Uncharacterized protein n=1 Tax=Pyxidicoccus fallax TaxID=394095 RepID=A0A848LRK5_9BACT|nr:hypothetical protein [Pyxidicoccus fallax]NMO20558.1 hypothetical protein [Pyxidicoccus fallax]NPC82852.1 hypothetical protein [Pyxidicoccus fallax]
MSDLFALRYLEAADWHGSELIDFDDLKSLGRAWLSQDDAAAASEPTAKPERGGAKKAASKAGAKKATRAGRKAGAKMATKAGRGLRRAGARAATSAPR